MWLGRFAAFPLTAMILLAAAPAAAISFAQAQRLTVQGGHSWGVDAASGDGVVHVVWYDTYNADGGGDFDIWYARYSAVTGTFETILKLTEDAKQQTHPRIAAAGNTLLVAWRDYRDDPQGLFDDSASEVYLRRSVDGGTSWEGEQRVTSNTSMSRVGSVALSGSRAAVVYYDDRAGQTDIYLRQSLSMGAAGTWSGEIALTDTSQQIDSSMPIATYDQAGRLHVVWRTNPQGLPQGGFPPFDIAHATSFDGNASFGSGYQVLSLALPAFNANTYAPRIIGDASGRLYASWWEERGGVNAQFRRSTDQGTTWGPQVSLSALGTASGFSRGADLDTVSLAPFGTDGVAAFWSTKEVDDGPDHSTRGAVQFSFSTDAGVSWSPPGRVGSTEISKAAQYPAAAWDGLDSLVVFWEDARDGGEDEIYYAVSSITPVPWSSPPVVALVPLILGLLLVRRRSTGAVVVAFAVVTVVALAATGLSAETRFGPEGAIVTGIWVDPGNGSKIYVGTEGGGVYRSTDAGVSWSPYGTPGGLFVRDVEGFQGRLVVAAQSGLYSAALTTSSPTWQQLTYGAVWSLDAEGGEIYAGTHGSGVLRSTDGVTFEPRNGGLQNLDVRAVAVEGGTLYAGTEGQGVFKSTDSGSSWSALAALPNQVIRALAIEPGTPSRVYAGTHDSSINDGRFYVSTDGGASWTEPLGLQFFGVRAIAVAPSDVNTVYIASHCCGVATSTDRGASLAAWPADLATVRSLSLAVDPLDPARTYVGTFGRGLWTTTDRGQSYAKTSSGMSTSRVEAIAVSPTDGNRFWVGGPGGVHRTTDGGASWVHMTSIGDLPGSANATVTALATSGGALIAGTALRGLYRSSDGVGDFVKVSDSGGLTKVHDLAPSPTTSGEIYAGGMGKIVKSVNTGTSWASASSGLSSPYVASLLVTVARGVYAGRWDHGLARSTDGGGRWVDVSAPVEGFVRLTFYDLVETTQDMFIGATDQGLYVSFGTPTSFGPLATPGSSRVFCCLARSPSNSAHVFAGLFAGGVLASTDGGATWSPLSGYETTPVRALAVTAGDVLLVGTPAGLDR